MIYGMLAGLPASVLPGQGEVMEPGDDEHGVVDAIAFETAVAEGLPGLHACKGVLDAGSDFAVGRVVFLFPGGEFGLAGFSAVRDDQAGSAVAAVGDDRGAAHRFERPPDERLGEAGRS